MLTLVNNAKLLIALDPCLAGKFNKWFLFESKWIQLVRFLESGLTCSTWKLIVWVSVNSFDAYYTISRSNKYNYSVFEIENDFNYYFENDILWVCSFDQWIYVSDSIKFHHLWILIIHSRYKSRSCNFERCNFQLVEVQKVFIQIEFPNEVNITRECVRQCTN